MASKNYFEKLKNKLIIVLSVICLFSFSAFALIGCNDTDENSFNDETYYITTEDNGLITNQGFSFKDDYFGIKKEDFPLTAPTGWSKAVDSAPASAVDSGAVSVLEEDWKILLSTLYDDADFAKYLQNKYEYDNAEIKRFLNAENPSAITDEQVKTYVIDHLLIGNDFLGGTLGGDYKAPTTHLNATDNYVYMLNNYLSSVDFGLGTAQKATSSSTVLLEKNKTYKLSVWVKTINLSSYNPDSDFGATIRLSNNFNSTLQAEYRITNIKSTEWTEYSLYIKADKDYGASFTLSLGLGLGNGTSTNSKFWTEGTALFDDITFEEVETIPTGLENKTFTYGSTKVINQTAGANTSFIYDLDLTNSLSAFGGFTPAGTLTGDYTKSNVKVGNDYIDSRYFDTTSTATMTGPDADGVYKVELKNSSFTVPVLSNISLNGEEFAYLEFHVKSDLLELAHKSVTVDVLDKYTDGTNSYSVNRASVASYTQEKVGEWTKCSLLIKNNFADKTRTFDAKITFGPSNIADIKYTSEFATGTVEFKDLKYLTGKLNADEYITADYETGADNPKYKLIKLFENTGSVTSLYAGYSEDYKDASDETIEYAIKSAPGNMGEIISAPTNAIGFTGVISNHSYVKKQVAGETLETAINDRIGAGTANGQAGLINSKYLATYGNGIDTALNHTSTDPVQVLMINNKVADSYGYITPSKTLNANTYAKASVTLRVVGDAKAYVYLVNTYNEQKEIMTFVDFTVNTDIVNGVEKGTEISGSSNKFELSVDSSMMNYDGWVTVEFLLATGEKDKQFRLEVWNGSRDGANKSTGFVFIKNAEISITDDAFTIPSRWADSFSEPTSPLFGASRENLTLYAYEQPLNNDEIAFNKEYPEKAVSYNPNYVWAKNDTRIFASFASIECAYVNPYDNLEVEEEESGCAAETDPSTFWLSFSSIILAVVLILAIIVLFVKNIRRRRKYYGKEKKNTYRVQSRITTHKNNQRKLQELAKKEEQTDDEEEIQESFEMVEEITDNTEEEKTEEDLDSYVYGEVQDFGEDKTEN